jgi:hypothetical protein
MGTNLPSVDLGAGRTAVAVRAGRSFTCALLVRLRLGREIRLLSPNNQRQHRTLHIPKDVLPYALCNLLCPVLASEAHDHGRITPCW